MTCDTTRGSDIEIRQQVRPDGVCGCLDGRNRGANGSGLRAGNLPRLLQVDGSVAQYPCGAHKGEPQVDLMFSRNRLHLARDELVSRIRILTVAFVEQTLREVVRARLQG